MSQNECPVKFFGSSNLLFRQNKPIKFENSIIIACCTEINPFLGAELETKVRFFGVWFKNHGSVFGQICHGPSVSQNEVSVKPSEKTNQ